MAFVKRKFKSLEMKNYTRLKAIVEVFGQYGIAPVAKVRQADFVKDLGFDKVFLNGLIFDVENVLHMELDEEIVQSLRKPEDLMQYFLQHQN